MSVKNAVEVVIANSTGINADDLYVYITDGNNNFYLVDATNNWTATAQSTMCNIQLSALPTNAAGLPYFLISSSSAITGGRVWFATSDAALSVNSSGGITQPTVFENYVFDFVEIATNPPVAGTTTPGNANIDTTQVDALGIPITVFVNPKANGLTFPPQSTFKPSDGGFPNVIGITPWMDLETIIANFTANLGATNAPYSACSWSGGGVSRLVAPFHVINDYQTSVAPTALATFLDTALYQFFNYYMTESLTLQDPVSLNTYSGQVTTVTEADITGTNSTYNVLQFNCGGELLNVYYPYFTTNCTAWPGNLSSGVVLSPPPSWWSTNLDTAMPATAMLLGCDGVFSDSAFQTGVTNTTLLGNFENQVASLLNRGLSPAIDNLIIFNAQYTAANIENNQVSLTTLPSNTVFSTGMQMVRQVAAQPLEVISVAMVGNNAAQIIITNPVGPMLPVNSCEFICGQFYPNTTNAAGYSNTYSNYLHNGLGSAPAPLLNNIGYGYAYDDQGGYSNDITVNYDANNSLSLGIFLGPLTSTTK